MKTKQTLQLSIENAVKIVKPFVSKSFTRPVLTCAYVTPEYVMATDSHRAIRIKHNETIQDTYLHSYKEEETGNYPNLDRLFPPTYNAKESFTINIKEWLSLHTSALVASKQYDNKNVQLKNNELIAKPKLFNVVKGNKKNNDVSKIAGIGWKDIPIPEHEQISFSCSLDSEFLEVAYNCKYMIDLLKAFKAMKETEVTLHFYGPMRPILFTSDTADALILPIRTT